MNIIDLDNQTELHIDLDPLEKIAQSLTDREIELIITDNKTIAALNQEYRSKDTATDVLSFPVENAVAHMPLGSIVISADFVQTKAKKLGHSDKDELFLLFIHGLLHLVGYDHENDNGEMRKKEKELIQRFDLPSSLIVRTEEL